MLRKESSTVKELDFFTNADGRAMVSLKIGFRKNTYKTQRKFLTHGKSRLRIKNCKNKNYTLSSQILPPQAIFTICYSFFRLHLALHHYNLRLSFIILQTSPRSSRNNSASKPMRTTCPPYSFCFFSWSPTSHSIPYNFPPHFHPRPILMHHIEVVPYLHGLLP